MLNTNMAPGTTSQAQLHPSAMAQQAPPPPSKPPVQIKIPDAPQESELTEGEKVDEDIDLSDASREDNGESERGDADDTTSLPLCTAASVSVPESDTSASETPATPQAKPAARKRPSTELESDADAAPFPPSPDRSECNFIPLKRARRDGPFDRASPPFSHPLSTRYTSQRKLPQSLTSLPTQQRKRSSEDLELAVRETPARGKRMRQDEMIGPLTPLDKGLTLTPSHVLNTIPPGSTEKSAATGVVLAD